MMEEEHNNHQLEQVEEKQSQQQQQQHRQAGGEAPCEEDEPQQQQSEVDEDQQQQPEADENQQQVDEDTQQQVDEDTQQQQQPEADENQQQVDDDPQQQVDEDPQQQQQNTQEMDQQQQHTHGKEDEQKEQQQNHTDESKSQQRQESSSSTIQEVITTGAQIQPTSSNEKRKKTAKMDNKRNTIEKTNEKEADNTTEITEQEKGEEKREGQKQVKKPLPTPPAKPLSSPPSPSPSPISSSGTIPSNGIIDLQREIGSFALFYGAVAAIPTFHERKILNGFDLVVLDFENVKCSISEHRQAGVTLARVCLRVQSDTGNSVDLRLTRQFVAKLRSSSQKIHGLYVSDLEEITGVYGIEEAVKNLQALMKEANGLLIFTNGTTAFGSSDYLQQHTHGLVLDHPTMNSDGGYRLLPDPLLTKALEASKVQMQRRIDFIVMAHECVPEEFLKGSRVARFVKFCQTRKLVPMLCIDCSHSQADKVKPVNPSPLGPLAVLSGRHVEEFLCVYKLAQEKGCANSCDKSALLNEIQSLAQRLGHDIDSGSLQRSLDGLLSQYMHHKEKAYLVWLGLGSVTFQEMAVRCEQMGILKLSEMYGEVSQLFKIALQCEEIYTNLPHERLVDGKAKASESLAVTIQCDVLDKLSSDGDIAEGSSGQREFGISYRENEYNRVVEIQERLRRKNLLKNLSKKSVKEVTSEGSEGVKRLEVYENKFVEMLGILDQIIYQSRRTEVYAVFDNTLIMSHMKQLRTALETDHYCGVQLWECDPQSLRFASLAGERRYFSVWKRDETNSPKILHVYVSRHHPNIAEAVIHAYFASRGYMHTACVILETLCRRASANPASTTNTEAWRKYDALPERFISQLLHSSYRDLARYILQTQKITLRLQSPQVPEKQRLFAIKMAEQVKAASKFMLLDEVKAREVKQQWSRKLLGAADDEAKQEGLTGVPDQMSVEGLQGQLEQIFQEASWQEGALAVLDNILRIFTHGIKLTVGGVHATIVPTVLHKVLTETGRRCALDELEMQVRDSNAYLLRESDLVTVYLEFNGLTEIDAQRLFDMSKFNLGQVLYKRIRDKMEQENPPVESFDPPTGSYDEKLENVLSFRAWMSNWGNGLFFMLFMAINLVVVLATGTGAYTSIHMPRELSQAVAMAMICAYISAGSVNACISRLGSMYMYQWSFSLLLLILTRFLVCGFLVALCVTAVAGIPMLLLMNTYRAAVFLIFYLLFLMMLLLMGALLTIKRGSVWKSAAGMWVLIAQLLEIVIVFALFYVIPEAHNPFTGNFAFVVHVVGLLVCVAIMVVAFFILAHTQTIYVSNVNPTKEEDLYAWYAKSKGGVKPPSPSSNDDALCKWYCEVFPSAGEADTSPEGVKAFARIAKKEAQKVWADARNTFSAAIEAQKKKLFPSRGTADLLIRQRAAHYGDEELLMKWYILLTSKPRPKPYSRDWDALLAEGKEAYAIKWKTDSMMRGGLLWETVAAELIRGTFYYALLFSDRIVQLIYTGPGTLGWFLPTSRYELSAGWGLVCLLISISALEAIPYRLLSVDLGAPVRFDPKSLTSDLDMVRARRHALRKFYFWDKLKITAIYILCAGVCGALLWWYSNQFPMSSPLPAVLSFANGSVSSILLLYGAFVIGFLGFVLGTYNALFLYDCLGFVGASLVASTIIGIISGYVFVSILRNSDASVTALIVAGWLYYAITLVKFLINSYKIARPSKIADSKWGALQTSAMMTSGQRWVGSDLAEAPGTHTHLLQHLLETQRCVVLTPDTDTGLEVANLLQKALIRWKSLPENVLLRAAFPQAGQMFHSLSKHWHAEKIILCVVEEGDLKLAEDEGFAAFSMSTGSDAETVLQIFVGLNEDNCARRIAEALVHEYAERFMSLPHRRAVIMELLMSTNVNFDVPARIQRQLSTASKKRLLRLADDTDDTILDLVAGNSTLEKWESLTSTARIAIVALLELPVWALQSPTDSYVPIFSMDNTSGISLLEQGIADLQIEKCWPAGTAVEQIASAILSSQLAIVIKRAAVELCALRMTAYTDQQQTIPIHAALPQRKLEAMVPTDDLKARLSLENGHNQTHGGLRQRVDAFLRLGFLAFTADDTFTQEWAYIHNHKEKEDGFGKVSRILSLPLLLIHNAARNITQGLIWTVLLTRRKDIGLLHDQLSRGIYGNETRDAQGLLLRMQYHTPGGRPRTAFVKHHEAQESGNALPEGQHASVMDLYPQLLETEPQDKRGREATVMYLPDGRTDRMVEYSNGAVKIVAIYCHNNNEILPESKFAYRTSNALIGSAPRSEVMRCPPLHVVHYDELGRPLRVTFHHEFRGHKVPISAIYKYSNDDPYSEPAEVEYNRVPDTSSADFHDYYKLTVRYHKFTSRVHSVDSRKDDATGSSLRTFFVYRNLKHCNKITFKLNEKGELGRTPTRFLTPVVIKDDVFNLVSGPPMQPILQELMIAYQTRKLSWKSRWFGKFHNKTDLLLGSQYPTLKARVMLWKSWNKGKLEGVFTGFWDESLLRNEPDLKGYWRKRDWGKPAAAIEELIKIQTTVTAKIQPDASHPELRTHKLIKIADMKNLVPGGCCNEMASAQSENKIINDLGDAPALDVVGLDSGTWPADGGGVASCRRDLVDRLLSVSWTQMAEVGTPMKLTMYQIEQNVRSLTLVPLWGDILGDPCASIFTCTPYSTLSTRKWRTTSQVIEQYFIPLLWQLVDACALQPTITDRVLAEHTSLVVNLYTYFQEYDWQVTWTHPLVCAEWRSRWCGSFAKGKKAPGSIQKLLAAEYPTVTDLDMLLSLFGHFLFPITVPLPPHPVYHASHHGVQTILGVIAKQLYGSSLIIWDHGMLWREKTKAIAELWQFSPFVRNGLLGLSRLALHINYYNATTITSCCTRGNPDWELWLGGRGGSEHTPSRTAMHWRMSPVVNGMETDKFMPRYSQESPEPTVVQLSHVYDLKDIKTAIRAASIIVNVFKLTTYRLLVFGSTNKDVDYTSECKELISEEGLSSNVFLMGLADATKVLAQGWVFLNSSQSEGLPLALGEAGLSGLPVVCTDVGGSREVVTDGETVLGRVVPPRNPMAVARAEVEVLAMLNSDELAEFEPISANAQRLLTRMKEAISSRRHLGNMFRSFVMENFGMERYLREHEQQIWSGSMRCDETRMEALAISKGMAVRHAPQAVIRHFRSEVASKLTEIKDGDSTSPDPLFDLYADVSFRMIETAIHKNRQNFIQQFATRNNSPHARRIPYKHALPPVSKNNEGAKSSNNNMASGSKHPSTSPKQKLLSLLSPKHLQNPFSRNSPSPPKVPSPSQSLLKRISARKIISSPFSPSRQKVPSQSSNTTPPSTKTEKAVTPSTVRPTMSPLSPTGMQSSPISSLPPHVQSAPVLHISSPLLTSVSSEPQPPFSIPSPSSIETPTQNPSPILETPTQKSTQSRTPSPILSPLMRSSPSLAASHSPPLASTQTDTVDSPLNLSPQDIPLQEITKVNIHK